MRLLSGALFAAAALVAAGPLAGAQPAVEAVTPSDGSTLEEAPPEVVVELATRPGRGSRLVVERCGRAVGSSPARVRGDTLVAALQDTGPGAYEARYRVAQPRGESLRGSFTFDVGAGAAACDETGGRRGPTDPGPSIWDIPLDDFALALVFAALIGAAGGHVYAGIVGPPR